MRHEKQLSTIANCAEVQTNCFTQNSHSTVLVTNIEVYDIILTARFFLHNVSTVSSANIQ